MSVSTAVELEWGGAKRSFALPNAQARELERETGFGIVMLHARLRAKAWTLDELRHTLRRALIGGGENALIADKLLSDYFDDIRIPRASHVMPCILITGAWLNGIEEAIEGNAEGEVAAG